MFTAKADRRANNVGQDKSKSEWPTVHEYAPREKPNAQVRTRRSPVAAFLLLQALAWEPLDPYWRERIPDSCHRRTAASIAFPNRRRALDTGRSGCELHHLEKQPTRLVARLIQIAPRTRQ